MITIVLAAVIAATAQPATPPMDHSKHQQEKGEPKGMDCCKMPCCDKMSAGKADKPATAKPSGLQH